MKILYRLFLIIFFMMYAYLAHCDTQVNTPQVNTAQVNIFKDVVNDSLDNNFLDTVFYVNSITSRYNIHPFVVLGIAWNETKFEPYAINMNRFNFILYDTKEVITFFEILKEGINNARSFINLTKLYISVYYGGKIIKNIECVYSMNTNKDINDVNFRYIRAELNKIKKYNLIRIRSGGHVPIIFKNKYNAIFFTNLLLQYTSNIDIGLTQINYNYWIKKYNIEPALVFDPANAISLSSQILKSIGEETNWDLYKMIKYYHSRNKIGDAYAKKVINVINVLTNLYSNYTNKDEKVASINNTN